METLGTRAYWVVRPGRGELRAELVTAAPPEGRSLVRADYGGVSCGTERLVGLGRVPASCAGSMACRYMAGDFALPVKYGYDFVGTGIAGALSGKRVFTMHPHQELALVEDAHATILPDSIPSARATLIPNLETALNAVWDGELARGEPSVVVGAGAVGLLVAYVLHFTLGSPVTVIDVRKDRLKLAESLPWVTRLVRADSAERGAARVAFHTSGTAGGLQVGLDSVGFEGRVIELSWYGDKPVSIQLGGDFHHQRKRIVASQVANIAAPKRATHGFGERLAEVLALLEDPALDRLVGRPIAFDDLPATMEQLYEGSPLPPVPLIRYNGTAG